MRASASPAGLDPNVIKQHQADAEAGKVPGRSVPQVPPLEHLNLTQFPSQYFQCVDQHEEVFHIVATRVTFDMRLTSNGGVLVHAKEQTPLCAKDVWSGAVNESSPLWESDFAPFKPQCDILVANAVTRPPKSEWAKVTGAPDGGEQRQGKRWQCAVALEWPVSAKKKQTWQKSLVATGPRNYGLLSLENPRPTPEVAITWENAFGGQVKEPALDQLNHDGTLRVKAGAKRWKTDERNPVGIGKFNTLGQPGPQLEVSMQKPYTSGLYSNYPPVSLTPLARSWLPRRNLAGTYDNDWLETQWPLPPLDFDYAYWNCAPDDQQVAYPPPGTQISLLNLYNAKQGSDAPEVWQAKLPQDQLFVRWRGTGMEPVNQALSLDTLVVDMGTQQIYAVYRAVLSAQAPVKAVATDSESNPGVLRQLRLRARKT